jgi:hypothetical protein
MDGQQDWNQAHEDNFQVTGKVSVWAEPGYGGRADQKEGCKNSKPKPCRRDAEERTWQRHGVISIHAETASLVQAG